MNITDADRKLAAQVARPRTERQYRGTGTYRVTVGGIVVGSVIKIDGPQNEIYWIARDVDDERVGGANRTRKDAVARLGSTDFAVKAYRDAALEGTFGYAEKARVQAELDAFIAAQDVTPPAFGDIITGPSVAVGTVRTGKVQSVIEPGDWLAYSDQREKHYMIDDGSGFQRRVTWNGAPFQPARRSHNVANHSNAFCYCPAAGNHELCANPACPKCYPEAAPEQTGSCPLPGGICNPDVDHDHDPLSPELAAMLGEPTFEVTEILTIDTTEAQPGDVIVALGKEAIEDGPEVHSRVEHVGREDGPLGVRLKGGRTTVHYLYVDQYPRITVHRKLG